MGRLKIEPFIFKGSILLQSPGKTDTYAFFLSSTAAAAVNQHNTVLLCQSRLSISINKVVGQVYDRDQWLLQ